MPINIGSGYHRIIRNLSTPGPTRSADQIARDRTDFAYREYLDRIFPRNSEGAEYAARMYHFIPTLTETPVDRLIGRLARRFT